MCIAYKISNTRDIPCRNFFFVCNRPFYQFHYITCTIKNLQKRFKFFFFHHTRWTKSMNKRSLYRQTEPAAPNRINKKHKERRTCSSGSPLPVPIRLLLIPCPPASCFFMQGRFFHCGSAAGICPGLQVVSGQGTTPFFRALKF